MRAVRQSTQLCLASDVRYVWVASGTFAFGFLRSCVTCLIMCLLIYVLDFVPPGSMNRIFCDLETARYEGCGRFSAHTVPLVTAPQDFLYTRSASALVHELSAI